MSGTLQGCLEQFFNSLHAWMILYPSTAFQYLHPPSLSDHLIHQDTAATEAFNDSILPFSGMLTKKSHFLCSADSWPSLPITSARELSNPAGWIPSKSAPAIQMPWAFRSSSNLPNCLLWLWACTHRTWEALQPGQTHRSAFGNNDSMGSAIRQYEWHPDCAGRSLHPNNQKRVFPGM